MTSKDKDKAIELLIHQLYLTGDCVGCPAICLGNKDRDKCMKLIRQWVEKETEK